MVFASIEHPPVLGGTIKTARRQGRAEGQGRPADGHDRPIKFPVQFQPLGGVAVIADNTWAAMQGRKKLKIEWDDGAHASFNSEAFKQELIASVHQTAKVARNLGNVDAEFAKGAGKMLEATYYTPLAAHAAMEPPVAVADFRNGKVEVWTPTQNPQAVQETVAAAVGIDKKNVTCHVTLLGGGFGRKSKPDYAAEAAVLSQESSASPSKVIWTREDDIHFDFYHTTAAVYHKAAVDGRGKPTAWLQRSVFPPIGVDVRGRREPLGFELDLGLTDLPFDIPNIRAENAGMPRTSGSAGSAPSRTTTTRSPRTASPTRWRTPRAATRSSSCST